MRGRLVREKRRVDASYHDLRAARAEVVRKAVSLDGRARDDAYRDEVELFVVRDFRHARAAEPYVEAEVGRRERREHSAREGRLAKRHREEGKRYLVYLPVGQEYKKPFLALHLEISIQGERRTNTALWSEMRSAGTTSGGPSGDSPRETM